MFRFINGILGPKMILLMFLLLLLGVVLYIYGAVALMTIARRTNTKNAWLAWIPIANIYLMMKIGKLPAWTLALWALVFVPVVSGLAASGMSIWYWWAIAERRKRPGWWGILMIIPLLNLVLMGIMAWGKDPKAKAATKTSKTPTAEKEPVKKKAVSRKAPKKASKKKSSKKKSSTKKKSAKKKSSKKKTTKGKK